MQDPRRSWIGTPITIGVPNHGLLKVRSCAGCDPCYVSIYSPGDQREIINTHSESPKEEFRVMELPQSGKIQPRIIDPIYPPVTQSRSRLDSSHSGSKRLSLSSGLPRAALSIRGNGATPKYNKARNTAPIRNGTVYRRCSLFPVARRPIQCMTATLEAYPDSIDE